MNTERNTEVRNGIEKGISYDSYRKLMAELVAQGKTTGPLQNEEMAHYTKMNAVRMKRLDKTTDLLPETLKFIDHVDRKQTWLIITEAWCGDAAQIIPVIQKIADQNSQVRTKYVLRDENEALMSHFLTDGAKSIPIVIVWDEEEKKVLASFGPRPSVMQAMVIARKSDPNASPYQEFIIDAQKWYAAEKTVSIQKEFVSIFDIVNV